ncbi:MAG TPA: AraC family transcriptional regulator [Vicinamibacterales bacterium]|nr:AraC family transcriptional regulator [Vicinamibacterales bacterium]
MRIAKVYLLKWHDEGQLPYEPLVRQQLHTDGVGRDCEHWLREHFRVPGAVAGVMSHSRIAERTLKRRFKLATGLAIIDDVQNLRLEEAKRLLESESSDEPVDEIGFPIGYEDPSFFRRLFKRRTRISPGRYRRMFQPLHQGMPAGATAGATTHRVARSAELRQLRAR